MEKYQAGIDIGSTTVKLVIVNQAKQIIFTEYVRHYSAIRQAIAQIFKRVSEQLGYEFELAIMVTGSAGIGLAEVYQLPFVQEVIACTEAVDVFLPESDVVIELGGEDAKITFLRDSFEQRMNGTCAGGTGAFIDQMATLLGTDANGVNELAKRATTIYPIASRCGVFAKTDVQPLINQGAKKEDISASILQAVVNQAIASLAAGRKIIGNVAFLGGPLFFLSELRRIFAKTLELKDEQVIFPEHALVYVALGAAVHPKNTHYLSSDDLFTKMNQLEFFVETEKKLPALFENEAELLAFRQRHAQAQVKTRSLKEYEGPIFLGIDAGSTTTKAVAIDQDCQIVFEYYTTNHGDPLKTVRTILLTLYQAIDRAVAHQSIYIGNATVTGYGEELIKKAFHLDHGIVETMAHFKAAKYFDPEVDFILDIGGQDMKAISLKNGFVSSIQLNEACSSGCGSFIAAFADSLGYSISDFAQTALLSKYPADLGSKCTVFMNSKVKQAQKEGHEVQDIAAGLAYSVVKNALYKVIRVRRAEDLGKHILVQGGTFYNESVLRALEKELAVNVVRPNIAGLMGAYGCAISSLEMFTSAETEKVSGILDSRALSNFTAEQESSRCKLCENTCALTVTGFADGGKFISGNRCERGAGITQTRNQSKKNLIDHRYKSLFGYSSLSFKKAKRGILGIPRALNIYDSYPLWHTVFTQLGFRVTLSARSTKKIYEKGLYSLASDTVCYPAKITHGHVQDLIDKGIKTIFFPSVVYEKAEFKHADNHMNCYVAMGYPKVIEHNIDEILHQKVDYHSPTLNLADKEKVVKEIALNFQNFHIAEAEVREAVELGYTALEEFRRNIRNEGEATLERILRKQEHGIVLGGRPYHVDPEISHGIAKLITAEGFHVLTEDSISHLGDVADLRITNQWEYASRLFAAAKVTAKISRLNFVQLNSFGCGLDPVATEQINEILEPYGKICTTLKIDEGANLGAIKIRLRSLKVALEEKAQKENKQTYLSKNVG